MKKERRLSSIARVCLICAIDALIIIACGYLSMLTRHAPDLPDDILSETTQGLYRLLISYMAVFAVSGMYRARWRNADALQIIKQALACVAGLGVSFVWEELLDLSLSRRYYLMIVFAFVLGGICGFRIIMKLIRDLTAEHRGEKKVSGRILTVRAGESEDSVRLFIDDIPVDGGISDIGDITVNRGINGIVVYLPASDTEFGDRVTAACMDTGCFVKRV